MERRRQENVPWNCEVFMDMPSELPIPIHEFLERLHRRLSKYGAEVASIAYKRKKSKSGDYLLVLFADPASARRVHGKAVTVNCLPSSFSHISVGPFNESVTLRARLSQRPRSCLRKGETWDAIRPLCFKTVGVQLGDMEDSRFRSYLHYSGLEKIITRFNFRVKEKATLDCTYHHPETEELQKLLLSLSDIISPIQIERRARSLVLWLTLQLPPRKLKLKASVQTSWDVWQGFGSWNRAIEHTALGKCNTMRIELLHPNPTDEKELLKKLEHVELPEHNVIHIQEFTLPDPEPYFWTADTMQKMPWFGTETVLPTLSFAVMFAINCLLSWRTLQRHSLTPEFLSALASPEHPESKVLDVLRRLWNPHESAKSLNTAQPDRAASILDTLKNYHSSPSPSLSLPSTYVGTYRAIITPSNVHFFGPIPETSCRVLRQHGNMVDRFLRVHFTDEGFNSIAYSKRETFEFDDMLSNIRTWMDRGIQMGDRHYKFLLYSTTQLREHQCWFFAEEGELTVSKLRHSLGQFKEITEVGKRAARMGQCFSSTHSAVEVDIRQVVEIEDITNKDGLCFTDGIGLISRDLAEKVAISLGLSYVPSAFQIRFGGCKGVVALNPNIKEGMHIRKSMKKFECDHHTLEICSYSRPLPAYLNRQGIMLLDNLGIKPDIFLKKQQEAIQAIEGIEHDASKALKLVSTQSKGNVGYHALATLLNVGWTLDDPLISAILYGLRTRLLTDLKLKARIPIAEGRHLIGTVDETHTLEYGQVFVQISTDLYLPTKKRKKSSSKQKREVKGDEEVSKKWRELATKVIEGPVVITKFPALHPGDMRTVQAVDVPSLRHMVDCVVFPSKGARPHPNELSGSDLDGDLYLVIWDKELIPTKPNQPAGDYSSPPSSSPETKAFEKGTLDARSERMVDEEQSREEEMKSYFLTYIKNDRLGIIASHWLAQSDKLGVTSPKCIRLARLHSDAVDFPKTARPVEVDNELLCSIYPHYMEKENTYHSKHVLGQLYDQVQAVQDLTHLDGDSVWQDERREKKVDDKDGGYLNRLSTMQEEEEEDEPNPDGEEEAAIRRYIEAKKRVVARVITQEGYEAYVSDAQRWKEEYNLQLECLMNQYGYTTEAEAITGDLLHLSRWHKKQKRDRSLAQTQEVMRALVADLWNTLREEFKREFSSPASTSAPSEDPMALKHRQDKEKKAKAFAWFYVVYAIPEEEEKVVGTRVFPLLSFAWVMAECTHSCCSVVTLRCRCCGCCCCLFCLMYIMTPCGSFLFDVVFEE